MSQYGHQAIDMGNRLANDHHEPHPPGLDEGPKLYDSSGPFFSLYSHVTGEEDNKMTDRWQQDATDGILVFSGLFSAAVTVLLAVSIQDLRPNSQDTSAFYLANIYQVFADPNFTLPRTSIPSSIAVPAPFSPPTYAVWVNSLWFLSLVISLSCALLAMLLRQWARRFIELTRREGYTPEKRARTRAFFSRGIEKMHVPWAVEVLPALLHLSFFLFFSGLLVFLFNINHSAFISVASCIGVFSFLYGWITFLPIFRPDSLYYGPLSPAAWLLYVALRSALFQPQAALRSALLQLQAALRSALLQLRAALQSPLIRVVFFIAYGSPKDPRNPPRSLAWRYGYRMSTGLWKVADEVVAKDRSPRMDVNILRWTMENALGEDNKLEKFFRAIPGLLQSNQSAISVANLADWPKFWHELDCFLHRTLSSDSVIESVKTSRLDAYLNLINERSKYHILRALGDLFRGTFGHLPQTIKKTNILARWCTDPDGEIALKARCVVARLLRSSQTHDHLWTACARDQLDIPHHLCLEITNRDEHTISLAILIQMTHQIRHSEPWDLGILSSFSRFHAHKASSRLQNEFCALWNRIVKEAMEEGYASDPVDVIRMIRHVYIALHQDTKAAPTAFNASTRDAHPLLFDPSSYPLCNIDHHQNSTALSSTQPDSPDVVYPHSSLMVSRLIAGGSTALHQGEDVNNVPRHSSSTAHPQALPHSQGLPSASPTTDPVHVPLQIASVMDPSIHESIQMIARDLIRLVSTEVLHPPSRSSSDRTANVVHRDPHADTLPPSVSVQQQLESNIREDVTASRPASDLTQTPFMANQITQITPNAGVTPQANEESTRVPPTVSESLSSHVTTPTLRSGVILIVLPPSVEFAPARPDRVSHAVRPPPSSPTTTGLPSPPADLEHSLNEL